LKEKKNWEWTLLKLLINQAEVSIVIDPKSFEALLYIGNEKIRFLPNPIPNDLFFTIGKFTNNRRLNRSILFVGHAIQTKGIFDLLEACIRIPDVKLKIIGPIQQDIKVRILKLAIGRDDGNWIEMLGKQSPTDVILAMVTTTVLVLPSYTEGFPNVILEGMACSCPIVATSVGAIPEMLNCNSDEKAGICVPSLDVNNLQQAIERMLDDKVFAKRCGESARKRVAEKYSMPIVWKQLISIWGNVS
jgi:glycosyltransferase involved in cell wall biosynthesis